MSWYTRDDALFDAWVTGNWGEDSVQREGEVTTEGLAGECDICGEWTNPLEQVSTASVDWFVCPSCAETMLAQQ